MRQAYGMFPRLPLLPARLARFQPLFLGSLALASLGYGFATENTGMMIIGAVGIAGAVLGVISARMEAAEASEEERAVKD